MKQIGILWMENRRLTDLNTTNAPYQMQTLKTQYQFCTQIKGTGSPSTPNYVSITSATTAGLTADANEMGYAAGPTTTANGGVTAPASGTWTLSATDTSAFNTSGTVWCD